MSGGEVTEGVQSCVYLNGTWKCIFDADMTQDINFYLLLNGKKVQIFSLEQKIWNEEFTDKFCSF